MGIIYGLIIFSFAGFVGVNPFRKSESAPKPLPEPPSEHDLTREARIMQVKAVLIGSGFAGAVGLMPALDEGLKHVSSCSFIYVASVLLLSLGVVGLVFLPWILRRVW